MDNFEQRMAAIDPAARFNVEDRLSGGNGKMSSSFTLKRWTTSVRAGRRRAQVPALSKLLEAREQLANPAPLHGWKGRSQRPA